MFDNLASTVTAPLFQQWEVNDQRQKLTYDLATAESQPNTGMAANSAHVHVLYYACACTIHVLYMCDMQCTYRFFTCMYIVHVL